MDLKMQMDLVPFTVPDEVGIRMSAGLRQDGFKYLPSLRLADLPAETLAALCDQFRTEVFEKACMVDPATLPSQIERAP